MLELAIKVSLVLGVALALTAIMRRASAAWRHRVLAVGLASALALPALGAILPRWSVLEPVEIEAVAPDVSPYAPALAPRTEDASLSIAPNRTIPTSALDLRAVAIALWALGCIVLFARLFTAHRAARRLAHGGSELCTLEPITARAAASSSRLVATAFEAYAALGGRRRVTVWIAPVAFPLTLGVLRPRVLLPEQATEWSTEGLRLTFLHELAHVERADVAWLLLAQLVRALWWWSPLAWLAARWLRREAELAADDRVIETGARASSYAEVLLRSAAVARMPAVAMGMARHSELERRISGVLGRAERSAPRFAGRTLTLGAAMGLAGVVACTGSQSVVPVVSTSDASADVPVDAIVREELAALVEQHSPRTARALVLDVATGRVLAMAAHGGDARREMVQTIEAGSTVKPLTLAIALEHGLDPERRFFLEHGTWELDGHAVRDWRDHGSLDVTGVLARSSNIGVGKIYLTVGAARTRAGLERLGIGRGSRIGIEDAERGALPPLEAWEGFSGVAYAAGITLTATPLELASAYGAIANDGVRVEPTFDGSGATERVLSPMTARRMREMLFRAVEDEDATGRNARVSGLTVAGKTGTAEIEGDRQRALFIGMFPYDTPRYVVYVDAEVGENRDGFTGGAIAAPTFARIASRIAER